ncbi:WlaTC/HtrL family glycosyltransferase, partial [Escherichia coli]|uniref:WlaTC/HtrL family glycosyltransferase n=2 Tax=Escherichia coli TaxID=562 RepID=UPI003CE4DF24
ADRNRSHWSTSKTPSYTKSVSWQHHPDLFNLNYLGRGKWFDLFRCFRSNTLGAKMQALRIFLSRK